MTRFSLPSFVLLQQQAEWLAPARARLLHLAEIASADARLGDPAKVAHLPMLLVTAVR